MIRAGQDPHQRRIQLTESFVQRKLLPWPEFKAALIIGSLAHGEARPDSDVDCLFVFDPLDERIVPAEFVWNPAVEAMLYRGGATEEQLLERRSILDRLLQTIEAQLQADGVTSGRGEAFAMTHPALGYAHNMESWKAAHRALREQR